MTIFGSIQYQILLFICNEFFGILVSQIWRYSSFGNIFGSFWKFHIFLVAVHISICLTLFGFCFIISCSIFCQFTNVLDLIFRYDFFYAIISILIHQCFKSLLWRFAKFRLVAYFSVIKISRLVYAAFRKFCIRLFTVFYFFNISVMNFFSFCSTTVFLFVGTLNMIRIKAFV